MINKDVASLISKQAAREDGAAAEYRALALWARVKGFFGVEKWLLKASAEELSHRDKMLDYLADMRDDTTVAAVLSHSGEVKSLKDMFDVVHKLECEFGDHIHEIFAAADKAGDYYSWQFLQFFLAEQLDAVRDTADICARLEACDTNLVEFDEWMADRA